MGEAPLVIDESGAALEKIAVKIGDDASTIVAKSADKIHLSILKKKNPVCG